MDRKASAACQISIKDRMELVQKRLKGSRTHQHLVSASHTNAQQSETAPAQCAGSVPLHNQQERVANSVLVTNCHCGLPQQTTGPMQRRLSWFLFRQHTAVHTGTGVAPAKAMFGRELPSSLHAILPAAAVHSEPRKKIAPCSPLLCMREPGRTVLVCQFSHGQT